jgi:hypothetical protein
MLVGAEKFLSQGSDLRYRGECETEYVPQFFPISIYLPYIVGGGCFALSKEGKHLLTSIEGFSYATPEIVNHAQSCRNSHR